MRTVKKAVLKSKPVPIHSSGMMIVAATAPLFIHAVPALGLPLYYPIS
jgi:hypothetical protein